MTDREMVMKEIEEHVPQDKEAILEIEEKLKPASAWELRGYINELAKEHDITNIVTALDNRNYLEVAWEMFELMKNIEPIVKLLK